MCELRMMEVISSGTSSDEQNEEHNVGNLFLEAVGQGWSSTLTDGFLEDYERARVAVTCNLALDLLFQEMHDA